MYLKYILRDKFVLCAVSIGFREEYNLAEFHDPETLYTYAVEVRY